MSAIKFGVFSFNYHDMKQTQLTYPFKDILFLKSSQNLFRPPNDIFSFLFFLLKQQGLRREHRRWRWRGRRHHHWWRHGRIHGVRQQGLEHAPRRIHQLKQPQRQRWRDQKVQQVRTYIIKYSILKRKLQQLLLTFQISVHLRVYVGIEPRDGRRGQRRLQLLLVQPLPRADEHGEEGVHKQYLPQCQQHTARTVRKGKIRVDYK